jgi:hypothetical protein
MVGLGGSDCFAIDFIANKTTKIAKIVEVFVKGSKNVRFSDIKRPNSLHSLQMNEVGIGGLGTRPLFYRAAHISVTT